jgi:hypothetical protein
MEIQSLPAFGGAKGDMRLKSTDFVVFLVLVLRLLYNSDFENEHKDKDEKNQIKSHAYDLYPQIG